ncbi:MBOAT, membrane-bound O-acyltransferase family-domain-containing protein [Suillus clintonianus]|uniref:MBOAT, membrane-bound O-acyltransferase family-domain-containing protein n=1 Tax=Suillus clintonianus TaxID=1904413 RepID=UPI001B8796B1|nr:MBOAT, membrane-bound O-acyltransferase family-domain-containing protein [Suillus clintonianus]KAG2128574.1 MBOAT, membrane-bound O-acyltransferase family-domain-containing protein [Suillus clintonianus]
MLSAPLLDKENSSDVTNFKSSPAARHGVQDTGPIVMTTLTEDGRFATTEGTLRVSKPFRSRSTKKLRAMITFEPRKTHFDTTNEASGTNEFRGFFTLFWMSLFLFTVQTYISSVEANGYALSFAFATMFSRHAVTLALSDLLLVSTTILCVPFAKAISKGWINYYWTGAILQHIFQTCVLIITITWTFHRQWPWVQSGFLTLHSFVMIMKMYSYVSVNGYLQWISRRSMDVLAELNRATAGVGGLEQALRDATSKKGEAEAAWRSAETQSTDVSTPVETCTPDAEGVLMKSFTDVKTAAALRQRLTAVSRGADGNTETEHGAVNGNGRGSEGVEVACVLSYHPDELVAGLAKEFLDLDSELVSAGPEQVRWPENVTYRNFAVYQLIPTLVYELEYPRTDRIRPVYIFEKTIAFMGSFALLYTVAECFIIPLTPTPDQSFFRSLLDLALPFMIAFLLLFYIIFECICNAFAELSYFADRLFYEDWWNSTSWEEFSRKWNKPVHSFLLRHVYASTRASYGVSRTTAMFFTFFLSAMAHELVMAIVTKKIRMYLFLMQLIQIPLILVCRAPVIQRNKLMGNVVFWLGLYAGFPLLCVAYVAY